MCKHEPTVPLPTRKPEAGEKVKDLYASTFGKADEYPVSHFANRIRYRVYQVILDHGQLQPHEHGELEDAQKYAEQQAIKTGKPYVVFQAVELVNPIKTVERTNMGDSDNE